MRLTHTVVALALVAMSPVSAAKAQIAVLSESVAEHGAFPGERYQGRLMIRNVGTEPQETRVYQTDYAFSADGRSAYGPPGSSARSNAKWVALSASYVVIQPGETVPVVYDVTVPADSTLRGTYWSIVMVEAIAPGVQESRRAADARVQMGLSVTTRYGTQIATTLSRSGASRLAFDSLTVTSDSSGTRGLRYDFINTGERALRFTMSVELYNADGDLVTKASQVRGLLYPGTSARQTFVVGTLPCGTYTAVLVADAGSDQVFGGQFKLTW